jgi:hypothetical protein
MTSTMTQRAEKSPDPNGIRSLRKALDLTLEAFGQPIGADASLMNKLEKGHIGLSERWINAIVEKYGVTADQVLRPPARGEAPQPRRPAPEFRSADIPAPPPAAMPADVPVRGTAAGSHMRGAFQLDDTTVVDWVRRPPGLAGARNAYALYIEGTSMEPEHRPGDLRFVHPDRPPRIGDSVIVQMRTGEHEPMEATIGHLLARTPTAIRIGKLKPEATVEIKRDVVVDIHRVLTMNDLFGV